MGKQWIIVGSTFKVECRVANANVANLITRSRSIDFIIKCLQQLNTVQ